MIKKLEYFQHDNLDTFFADFFLSFFFYFFLITTGKKKVYIILLQGQSSL